MHSYFPLCSPFKVPLPLVRIPDPWNFFLESGLQSLPFVGYPTTLPHAQEPPLPLFKKLSQSICCNQNMIGIVRKKFSLDKENPLLSLMQVKQCIRYLPNPIW